MQELRQARLDLGRILDNCDGCEHQKGDKNDASLRLKLCQTCVNYKAMQRKRKEIERLQAINRRGGLVSR